MSLTKNCVSATQSHIHLQKSMTLMSSPIGWWHNSLTYRIGLLCFRPVLIELPHIASLHNDEREVIAMRSDDGVTWHQHPVTASEIVAGLAKFAGEFTGHLVCYCTKEINLSSKLSQ